MKLAMGGRKGGEKNLRYEGRKMGFVDVLMMGLIISGAVYLFYRSVWKKKGHCPGCDSETCQKK